MRSISKSYVETNAGSIHVRKLTAEQERHSPLLCLHPAPSSGLFFKTVMPMLNAERTVICPDYPGYGGSVRLAEPPTISDYATCMAELLDNANIEQPVDILGFHTGCLVAVDMGLLAPEKVGKLILCDVPYFSAEERPALKEKNAQPMPLTGELQSLEPAWDFNVASRIDKVPLERGLELFAEQLRGGTNSHFAFSAAFSYSCEERFAELDSSTVVIATQSGLLDPSRMAASAISGARLIEALEITSPVFEGHSSAISEKILLALTDSDE